MIEYTLDHALASERVDRVIVSTDCEKAAGIARRRGVEVIERPAELASDTATVDAAARHAVEQFAIRNPQSAIRNVVILYANVPVRPRTLIDDAVTKLVETGCDSVQSVCAVGKMHPYWMKRVVEGDRLLPYVENTVYRRQELPAVYQLDGGIIAVTRKSLFVVEAGQPHAFLGKDRRAVITESGAPGSGVVDVDGAMDMRVAEAVIGKAEGGRRKAEVVIGGREIGGAAPTYVIAELGVNHDGSVERALALTRAAKGAGADAVKLQLFDPDLLLSAEAELAKYQEANAVDPYEMLRSLQLCVADMLKVKALAHELGMGFIVTPFSVENLEQMRELDADAVKIASPDAVNLPLIGAMLDLGKPMLISTGTANIDELHAANRLCAKHETVFLHCVSAYPTPPECAAVGRMNVLRDALRCEVGYSDHTSNDVSAVLAVGLGARVIEKHLTYDCAAKGPDHAASCDPRKFAEYVAAIGAAEAAMMFDETADVQADVRKVSRQSVCAVRDMKAGDVIGRGDVTVKRPGTGVAAARLAEVVGKTLKRDVKMNHLIHEEDL